MLFGIALASQEVLSVNSRSKLRASVLALVFAAELIAPVAASAESVMKLGNEGTYPPFSMIDASGRLTGFEPELARALCDHLKIKCDIQAMDFKALLPSLVSGKIDMIASQLWPTAERTSHADFTDPVLFNPNTFVVPKAWSKGYADADMKDVQIAVIRGSAQAEFLKKNFPSGALVYYDNPDQMQLDLVAGRVDVAYGSRLNWSVNLIQKSGGEKWKLSDKDFWDTGKPIGLSWAVKKGDADSLGKVNKGLKELLADCTYTKIRKRFIAVPATPDEPKDCLDK